MILDEKKPRTSSAVKNRYNSKNYKKYQATIKPDIYERIEKYISEQKLNKAQFLERAISALEEK